MAKDVSLLIDDLSNVPGIVGSLGLSIASAQKAFNLDYLENLEKLLAIAKSLFGQETTTNDEKIKEFSALLEKMVISLAPSRYQFTETTLSVKLDLAQTMSKATQAGLGVSVGAVAVNAAMTSAFGYDYRAAAEVKTVLHAISPDPATFKALLNQAKAINKTALTLPAAAEVDKSIIDTSSRIFEKVVGAKPTKIEAPTTPTPDNENV